MSTDVFADLTPVSPTKAVFDYLMPAAPEPKARKYVEPQFVPQVPTAGEPDTYRQQVFKSGLEAPKAAPVDLLDKKTKGDVFADLMPEAPKPSATGTALKNIAGAAWSGIKDTYSDDLGISPESFSKVMGNVSDPANRKSFVGNLRMLNYAIARTLTAPADIMFRSVPAAIEGSIRGFTQSLKEAGYSPQKADQLGGDLRMTADVSMAAFPEWDSRKSLNEVVARAKKRAVRDIAEGLAIPQGESAPQLTEGGAAHPNVMRLYRGEGADQEKGGGWFTTDPQKAALYGPVSYIDVSRDDLLHFAQGHGGADEWLTDNPEIRARAKPVAATPEPSRQPEARVEPPPPQASESTMLGMSDVEQANNDARFLSSQLLSLYQGGELTAAANRPFISALAKLIPTAERADFVTADGGLSQAGIRRLQNALFSRAWDSLELLSALREDQDTNIRAIGGAMTDAAPAWAAMRANLAETGRSDLDATSAIINAINMVKKARDDGQPIKMMVFQDDMFGGRADPAVENALRIFFKDEDFKLQRSRPDMAEGLRYIAAEAEKAQEGPGLFADIPQIGITDLLEANARRNEGGLLLGMTSSRAVEAGDVMPESGASSLQAMQPGANYAGMRQDVFDPNVPRADGDLVRREKIISDLSKALNVPIYRGRVKGKGRLGFFRRKIEEVRIKRQNDIEVVSHEIAHMLDDRFPEIRQTWTPKTPANNAIRQELAGVSYDKTKLYEGFAEFVRLWASQKAEAQVRAPQFFSWFENWLDRNPQVAAPLRKSQADIHSWFDQNALDRMQSKIGVDNSWNAYLDKFFDRFRQAGRDRFRQTYLDTGQGVARMERELTGQLNPGGAYETYRLVAGSRAITEGALRWGVPTVMPDGSTAFVGKGLEQVISPVVKRLDDWILYAIGRSASELMRQGRENLFTKAELDAAAALETPEFLQAFNDYQTWNKGVVDFAEKKGLIDPAKRAQWQRDMYLPFYRVIDPQGVQVGRGHTPTPGAWSGIKRLTGGTGNLRDIMGNIIQNASMLIEGGIEAEARRTIADLSQKNGGAHFMAKIPKNSLPVKIDAEQIGKTVADSLGVPTSDPMVRALTAQLDPLLTFFQHGQAPHGRNIVSVLRGGKAEYYEVADPVLYRSLVGMRPAGKNAALKMIVGTRRLLQATITLSPNFLVAHLTRDAIQGWVLSENGFKPLFDSGRGVFSRMVEDQNYRDFVANGGGLFGSHLDGPQWRKHLETYYGKHGIPYNLVVNTPRKMKYLLERLADAAGSGTRVGEYNRAIKAGVEPRHAAFRGREVATDFAMHGDRAGALGSFVGFLTDMVPFLNASIVSADRLARSVYRSEEARLRVATRLATLAAASMALYMYNRTIPEYEKMDEWKKDMFTHIYIPMPDGSNLHFHIPKAWEIGLVMTLAERTAAAIVRDNSPESLPGQALRSIMNFEHIDPLSGVFQPFIETGFNINLFTGRPLVSQSTEQLEPWARSHPGMHPSLKKLGEAEQGLPTSLQVSPTTVDTFVHAYLGNYAETALTMADRFMSPIAPPERRWDEVPVVRRFYSQEPAKSTHYVEDFYRALEAAASAHQTVRQLAKEGDIEGAKKEAAKDAHELQTYPFLQQQNKVISAINKYRDAVFSAPDLKTLQDMAPTIAAAVGDTYKPMVGLKDKPAWKDVAKLKRVLIDALLQARNDRVEAVMKTVNPPPEPLVPR